MNKKILLESINRKKNSMKKGFTLIELLAVIVILAIIALIATPIVLDIIDSAKKSSVEATMKNIEKAALLEYSDLVLDGKEQEEIIYNCYDGKCTYNGKVLSVKGDVPDRGKIIVNEDGATFENIIIKGYNCIKNSDKFTCNNTGLTKVNGTSILIDNNKTTEIENYRIYGNSIQNGTPTPEKPVEVESVGDLVTLDNCSSYGEDACNNIGKYVIPIKVTGKNLFNVNGSLIQYSPDYYPTTVVDNKIYVKNFNGLPPSSLFDYIKVNALDIMSISYKKIQGNARLIFKMYDSFKNLINDSSIEIPDLTYNQYYQGYYKDDTKVTFTVPENVSYIRILISAAYSDGGNIYSEFQVENSSKITSYEPYKEMITNIYLDSPLRKVGDYADYIDFKTGKVVRNIDKNNINDLNIKNYYESSTYYPYGFFVAYAKLLKKKGPELLSNMYINTAKFSVDKVTFGNHSDYNFYIVDSSYTDVESLKNALNNIEVYYVLQNSIEQTLDLPELLINKDTSVISVNTSILPSNIELEYYR